MRRPNQAGEETVRATRFRAWPCGPKASQAQPVSRKNPAVDDQEVGPGSTALKPEARASPARSSGSNGAGANPGDSSRHAIETAALGREQLC